MEFQIKNTSECVRLDKFLALKLKDISRSQVAKMARNGDILVNAKKCKPSYLLKINDLIAMKEPILKKADFVLKAEDFNLEVLYEDKDVMAINKKAGIVVHPDLAGNHLKGSIAAAVLNKVEKGTGDALRPGIVHRLDKDTSGILLIAKTKKAYEELVKQFKEKSVKKYYFALVSGTFTKEEGFIDAPIGRNPKDRKKMAVLYGMNGKNAKTTYKVLENFNLGKYGKFALIEVEIETGRTHQIRVHMKHEGHPVIGDITYGNKKINTYFEKEFGLKRQFLHAHKISFLSPANGKQISVSLKLPPDLERVLDGLKKKSL